MRLAGCGLITLIELNSLGGFAQIDIQQKGKIENRRDVILIGGQRRPVVLLRFAELSVVTGNNAQIIQRMDMLGADPQNLLKPLFGSPEVSFRERNNTKIGRRTGLVRIIAGELLEA